MHRHTTFMFNDFKIVNDYCIPVAQALGLQHKGRAGSTHNAKNRFPEVNVNVY